MKMNKIYQETINETLKSVTTGQNFLDLTLNNELNFPVAVYLISDTGWWIGGAGPNLRGATGISRPGGAR